MQKKKKKFSKFDLSAGGIMTSFKKKIVVNVEAESARTYSERERAYLKAGGVQGHSGTYLSKG